VQKFCSDASGEVSGKITSLENCSDATLVQKFCSNVSGENSGEIRYVLLRTLFCYNEAKAGFFLLLGSNFGILVRNVFAPFIQFFCYNEPFSAALVHL
jgi:hypothetical protein